MTNDTLATLSNNYKSIFIIDLVANTMETIKTLPIVAEAIGEERNADVLFSMFVGNYCAETSREVSIKFHDLSTLKERFKGRESLSLVFQDFAGRWCRTSMIRADEGNELQKVFYTVEDMDDEEFSETMRNRIVSEQEEKRFKAIGEMLNVTRWQWKLDRNGDIAEIWGNESLKELYGYTFDAEGEQSIEAWLSGILPDYKEMASQMLEDFRNTKTEPAILDMEYPIYAGKGKIRWVHVLGRKLFNADGRATEAIGTVRDITAEVKVEEKHSALVSLAKTYKSVHRFNLATGRVETIFSTPEVEQWVDVNRDGKATMQNFLLHLTADDSREQCLEFADFDTLQERIRGKDSVSVVFKDPFDGWCRAVFVRVDEKDPVSSVLFTVESIDEQIQKDKRINDIINVLAENFSTVFYVENDGKRPHIIRTNHVEKELFELLHSDRPFSEMMHEYAKNSVHEENIKHFEELSNTEYALSALKGKERITYTYRRKINNEYAYYRMIVAPFQDGKGLIYGYENVNEEVQTSRELEARNKQVLAADAVIRVLTTEYHTVWIVDKETSIMRLVRSRSLEEHTSAVINEILKFDYWDEPAEFYVEQFVIPEDRPRVLHDIGFAQIIKHLEENDTFVINFRQPREDGTISYQQINFFNADTEDGTRQFVAAFRAVDEIINEQLKRQKEIEESKRVLEEANKALAQKDAALDLLYQMVDSGSWTLVHNPAVSGSIMTWNDDTRSMIGWTEEEMPASIKNWGKLLHPDDAPHVWEAGYAFIRKEISEFNSQFRLKTKEKGWRWFRSKSRYEYTDADGNAHYIGVLFDITDAKTKAEEQKRREQEEKRLAGVYEMIGAARWQWKLDSEGRPYDVWWDEKFTRLFGYDNDEEASFTTAAWIDRIAPEDRERILEATQRFDGSMEELEYDQEYRWITMKGEELWVHALARKVSGEKGEPTEVIGTFIDITAQKKAEWTTKIIGTLADEYDTIQEINLKEDTSVRYRYSGRIEEVHQTISGLPDSHCRAEAFVKLGVDPEYQEIMLDALNYTKLKTRIQTENEFSTIFKNTAGQYCEMKVVRVDDDRIVVGFANKDAQIREMRELSEVVSAQKLLIEGLTQEYDSVWHLNPQDHTIQIIGGNPLNSTGKSMIEDIKAMSPSQVKEYFAKHNVAVPEDRERLYRKMNMDYLKEHVEVGKPYQINYAINGIDGEKHYMQANVAKIIDQAGDTHLALALRVVDDVVLTELKKQEEHQKQLQDALEKAESASQAKSTFLFNMSHDIRTPLNAIKGFTELSGKYIDDSERLEDYRQKILLASNQLADIIDNVLEMARIENKKIVLEEELTDGDELFASLLAIFEGEIKKKNLTLKTELDVKHHYLYLDKTHVSEVLMNIISNAIKYTPEGGEISASFKELPGDKEGECLIESTIKDTGIGMSEEFVAQIFEEFARERNSSQSGIQGTGLGMAIVKRLVELMHGTISIKSQVGEGTEIRILLPHRIGEAPTADSSAIEMAPKDVLNGKHILIAEDIDVNAMLLQEILHMNGMVSERAKDGAECIAMLETAEAGYYDLILMDIQMPILNGYEASRQIRSLVDEQKACIPIIALSANAFKEDIERSLEAGMNGHLAKPIEMNALLAKLTELLSDHKVMSLDALLEVNGLSLDELKESKTAAYCTDDTRRIIFWNKAAEQVTGYTFEQLKGKHCFYSGLKHEDEKKHQLCVDRCPLMATIMSGTDRTEKVSALCSDGNRKWIEVHTRALVFNGKTYGAVEYFEELNK